MKAVIYARYSSDNQREESIEGQMRDCMQYAEYNDIQVDKDLFEKVQKRIEINTRAPAIHKAEDEYLLTTHLFCGKCKAMMIGDSGTGKKGTVYHYYKCANAKKTHTCDKKAVNKDKIENAVIKAVMAKIMNDDLMEQLSYRLYDIQMQSSTILPALQQQLADVESGIDNMLNAIQQGIVLDSTKKRLSDLENRKKELEIEIAQEQIKRPVLTREQIHFGLTKFRKLDLSTHKGKQTLIDGFVNAIYLFDDYAIITCNYKDGEEKITLEDIENSELGEFINEQKINPNKGVRIYSCLVKRIIANKNIVIFKVNNTELFCQVELPLSEYPLYGKQIAAS